MQARPYLMRVRALVLLESCEKMSIRVHSIQTQHLRDHSALAAATPINYTVVLLIAVLTAQCAHMGHLGF